MRRFVCVLVLAASVPLAGLGQEPVLVPPPSVRVDGMPAIPRAIADDLARYTQFRQAQMIAWHPTKRQLVVTTAFGQVPQLHLVDGPGRSRNQITWFKDGVSSKLFAAFDPADPNTLIFQRDPAGGEALSLFRYDATTGQTAPAVDAKSHFSPVWARQGKWIAYDSSERNGKDRDLYVVQPADPKTKRLLAQVEGPWAPQDWSPDGTRLLALEVVSNSETYIWQIDVATGARKALTPRQGSQAMWLDARYSADGRKVYAVNDSGDAARIWRGDVATGAWTPLTPEKDPIDTTTEVGSAWSSSFEISPDGAMMAILLDRGESNELQVLDLGTLKPRPLPALPPGIVSQLRWRPGTRELAFSLASVKSPGDVYSIDTSLGTISRWTTSETVFNPSAAAAGGRQLDIVRRPAHQRHSLPPGGPLRRSAPGHGADPRRTRRAQPCPFLGRSNYLLNEMGVAMHVPKRSRLGRLRPRVRGGGRRPAARRRHQRYRRHARLDRHAPRSRRTESFSSAPVTAAGSRSKPGLSTTAGSAASSKARASPISSPTWRRRNRAASIIAAANTATSAIPRCASTCYPISPTTRAAELKKPSDHCRGREGHVGSASARRRKS